MNLDYENFVARMGSFEMDVDEIGQRKDVNLTHFVKITEENQELYHFGVPGMRWGHRKSQYSANELSSRQKSKASKEYKKLAVKTEQDFANNQTNMYVKAHNKTADEWNGRKLEEFNKKNDSKSKDYEARYMKQVEKDLAKNLNQVHLEFMDNNPNYKKAKELVKKYDMLKYDDLAKDNTDFIETMRKQVSKQ